ncbi:MAG: small multi-drug export protein [Candidatus Bathyarchaeota archaeon]|nr:small multi-drug export protein [Candidatus Bathyarchaeota archaeon]
MENSSLETFLLFLLLSLLPTIELRGSIPYGLVYNFNPYFTLTLAIIMSSLVFFPIYYFLNIFYQKYIPRFFRIIVEKTRIRGQRYVDKYGLFGLAIFVAIPFPGSGVWSGSMLAWLLGIKWYKAFISIFIGNIAAGLIVFLITMGFLSF